MAAPSFDPTHAVRFDLPSGSVRTRGDDDRVVLLPTAALDELVRVAPVQAVEAFGRAMGTAIGRRAAARVGDVQAASVEAFVAQLSGEAAVAGIGSLHVERWGRALVVVVQGSPLAGSLLVSLVAAALEAASGRPARGALLSRDDAAARIFVGSEASVGRVREWIASGARWSEALVRLHEGRDGGAA
ncbi:MAG: hypothetical protein JOZ69_16575 [Myxococcales bacterium]|nr:hypothetical protein [Myxococcales bacterium]